MRDLTGETFGSLTVIGKAEDLNGRARWKCKCNKCGNVLDVLELGLLYRSPKCTCESKKALKDLKGKTIGQFYVIEKAESRRDSTGHLRGYWKCKCNKCGAISEIPAKNLNANKHLICRNCSNSTMPLGAAKPKLRMIYDRLNSYNSLCDEWRNSYPAFEKWAYDNGYDLEDKDNAFFIRLDQSQLYSPTNCIIEDRNNNPKIIVKVTDRNGSQLSVTDLQNKYNIPPVFTYRAKHQGYSDDQILSGQFVNAPYKIKNLEYKNAHGSMSDFYNALKIDREVFTKYVRDNMFDMDRAFEMMKKDNIPMAPLIFTNEEGNIISEDSAVRKYLSKTKYDGFIGKKFGHLTVIEDAGYKESGQYRYKMWKCQCDCGNITYVSSDALISGHTKSCGAPIHKETHGETGNRLYIV